MRPKKFFTSLVIMNFAVELSSPTNYFCSTRSIKVFSQLLIGYDPKKENKSRGFSFLQKIMLDGMNSTNHVVRCPKETAIASFFV